MPNGSVRWVRGEVRADGRFSTIAVTAVENGACGCPGIADMLALKTDDPKPTS